MTRDFTLCTRKHPTSDPIIVAENGTQLCRACHRDFITALTAIGDLWNDLHAGARRASDAQDVGFVQTSGITQVGDMWRPQVTQIIRDATDFTTYLVRLSRDINHDPRMTVADAEKEPLLALRIIARYLAHDLTHKLAGDLPRNIVSEALVLMRRGRAALDAPYVRRIKLNATCNHEVRIIAPDNTTTDVLCGGDLYAVLNPEKNRPSSILCTHDPRDHRIYQEQWLILADQLQEIQDAALEPAHG